MELDYLDVVDTQTTEVDLHSNQPVDNYNSPNYLYFENYRSLLKYYSNCLKVQRVRYSVEHYLLSAYHNSYYFLRFGYYWHLRQVPQVRIGNLSWLVLVVLMMIILVVMGG